MFHRVQIPQERVVRRLCLIISMLSLTFVGVAEGMPQDTPSASSLIELDISLCQFSVPEILENSTANFTLAYTFAVDADGRPNRITQVRSAGTGEFPNDEVIECLSKWRFEGLKTGTRVMVTLRWEHSRGWTVATISWKGFVQKISLSRKQARVEMNWRGNGDGAT